jgi:hypothetical protein
MAPDEVKPHGEVKTAEERRDEFFEWFCRENELDPRRLSRQDIFDICSHPAWKDLTREIYAPK